MTISKRTGDDSLKCRACGFADVSVGWRHKDMHLAECRACGLIFQTEESGAWQNTGLIDRIYAEYTGNRNTHLAINAARLEKMEKLLGRGLKGMKVLELGVGNGALGELLLARGADYRGFEPYRVCREMIAASAPALAGLVLPQPFSAVALGGETFDLVVANDALEHMRDPRGALEEIKKVLSAAGRLYLEVPDETLLRVKGGIRILFGMYVKGYPTNPDHLSLFRPASFRRLLEGAGFEIETLLRESVWGDPDRMKAAMGGKVPFYMLAAIHALKLTGLDLVLGGNIVAVSKPR